MNYVFLGDSPTLETGFARVTRNIVDKINLPNIHFWGIGYDCTPHSFKFNIYPANINSSWESKDNLGRFARFLLSLDGEITLVLIHDPFRLNKLTEKLKIIKNKKNIRIISYTPVDAPLKENQCKNIFELIDVPVAYNEFGKTQISRFTNKNVLIVPHGTEKEFHKKEVNKSKYFGGFLDKKIIGVVNSNSERKNLFRSLEILKYILEKDNSWIMYFHCDPNGYLDLKSLAQDMGIINSCVFADPFFDNTQIGYTNCDKQTLIEIYNCFDLFLSTSFGEGWGLTVTEAANCEIPIVIGNHTSFNNLFSDDSCIFLESSQPTIYNNNIVPDFDSKKSAEKILENYYNGLDSKIENAKNISSSFCWDKIANHWKTIIKKEKEKPIIVSTSMRVGSTWVTKIVSDILYNTLDYFYLDKYLDLNISNSSSKKKLISEICKEASIKKCIKSHSITPDQFKDFPDLKFINVLRNKKDSIRSRYFYSKYHVKSYGGNSDLLDYIKKNNKEKIEDENLLKELWAEKPQFFKNWINDYEIFNKELERENCITLYYEALCNKEKEEMEKLLRFIGKSNIESEKIYEKFSFDKMQKAEIKKTGRKGNELFHRKGGE